jgi:hypothetical protein
MSARSDVAIATLGATALAVLLVSVIAVEGCEPERDRAVAIDFSESTDSRIVYPMARDDDIVDDPSVVDLRFPGGRTYHNDRATMVWISRDPLEARHLIREVTVATSFATAEEAVDHARMLRGQWNLGEVDSLDDWLAARRRQGPGRMVVDVARGARRNIGDTRRDGRTLTVEYDLNSDAMLTLPYSISVTFSWW